MLQYYLEPLWKEIEDTVSSTYELGCTVSVCDEDFRADTALREEANPPKEASWRKRIFNTPVPLKWGEWGGGPSGSGSCPGRLILWVLVNTVFKRQWDINGRRGRVWRGCGGTGLSWAASLYILQP